MLYFKLYSIHFFNIRCNGVQNLKIFIEHFESQNSLRSPLKNANLENAFLVHTYK